MFLRLSISDKWAACAVWMLVKKKVGEFETATPPPVDLEAVVEG